MQPAPLALETPPPALALETPPPPVVALDTPPPARAIEAPPVVVLEAPPPAPVVAPMATLPPPGALPVGDPDEPAAPPGPALDGHTRSLRGVGPDGAATFAVVYRDGATLVIASGRVGRRGRWQAIDYPGQAAAGTGYAKACAGFIADGYVDL